jgi:hypothetical protein
MFDGGAINGAANGGIEDDADQFGEVWIFVHVGNHRAADDDLAAGVELSVFELGFLIEGVETEVELAATIQEFGAASGVVVGHESPPLKLLRARNGLAR